MRRSEASLPGHLANPDDEANGAANGTDEAAKTDGNDADNETEQSKGQTTSKLDDYQLAYAIDLLRGIALSSGREDR